MREIKFRAKNVTDGAWVYGLPLREIGGVWKIKYAAIETESTLMLDARIIDPETIGQFTGLKDKNGREIYEGDILKAKSEYGTFGPMRVYWEPTTLEYAVTDELGDADDIEENQPLYEFYDNGGSEVAVIGNIHENPELLK